MNDRTEFGDRQAEMTARWYENVKRQHGDVEAYLATRYTAYLDRWKEAGRFISDGSHVLDIGGGNLYERLVGYLKEREFRYNYLDVDPSAVEGSRALAEKLDLEGATFAHGFNDQLDFPDECFDAVFTSHCVEHSIDLAATFREINRVIRPGGNLLMAVPFGWEENPEHPYFLGPAEWVSLVEDAGFKVRVAQIGNEYPEYGEDYFIAARKIDAPVKNFRINPGDYLKESYIFVPFRDESVTYENAFDHREDCAISADPASVVSLALPVGAREVVPILHRHPWSGIVRLSTSAAARDVDLHSWFAFDMPYRMACGGSAVEELEIRIVGKSDTSKWAQFVFKGYFWR